MRIVRLAMVAATAVLLGACASTPKEKPAAPVKAMPAAASIAGSWKLTVDTPMGPNESTLTAVQDGENFTGKLASARGERPVSGTVKGSDVAFGLQISVQGMDLKIDYTGTIDGNTMKGKVKFGDYGEGTFTGTKL